MAGDKFPLFTRVKHVKTNAVYEIRGTPSRFTLEATGETAYVYTIADMPNAPLWIREKSQMEDGRFVKA